MPAKKATHQQTKQHNRDLILKTLFDNPEISRAEIARSTKLTRATVSDMVADLLEEGLVTEVGYGSSIGGRLPVLLSLNADSRYLIGLNLAQDKFIGAIVNLRGEIKETCESPVGSNNGEQALQTVYQILDRLVSTDCQPIVGIGIGTPGLVNAREGIVVNAVNLDWKDLPLAHLLESRYRLPVSVLNDSQAMAIGEFVYSGSYKSDDNLIVVNVGYGIGAGILINGRIFQGDGGGAGEIGHVAVQENGVACRCGKYGCLETVASARAVVQQAQILSETSDPQINSFESLQTAFLAGDPLAQRIVTEAGRYLGFSIASLVGTLNIKSILLTGDMTCFGEPWLNSVRDSMSEAALPRMVQDTQLEIGKLDFRGCILGASASMLLNGYSLLFTQTNID